MLAIKHYHGTLTDIQRKAMSFTVFHIGMELYIHIQLGYMQVEGLQCSPHKHYIHWTDINRASKTIKCDINQIESL